MGNHRIEEIFITNFLIGGFDGLNEKEFVFSVVKTLILCKWNIQVGSRSLRNYRKIWQIFSYTFWNK